VHTESNRQILRERIQDNDLRILQQYNLLSETVTSEVGHVRPNLASFGVREDTRDKLAIWSRLVPLCECPSYVDSFICGHILFVPVAASVTFQ